MPGASLFCSVSPSSFDRTHAIHSESFTKLFPHIAQETIRLSEQITLALQTHSSYQVFSAQCNNWLIFTEGSQAKEAMDLAVTFLQDDIPAGLSKSELTLFLRNIWNKNFNDLNGNFFFLAINSLKGLILYANDALARLPVYIYHQKGTFCLARDIGFVLNSAERPSPDHLFLALNTLFGYVPGRGTFYREIDTLPPATIGLYDISGQRNSMSSRPENRMPSCDSFGSKHQRSIQLCEIFQHATQRICQGKTPILALSGGLDSRAVGAALKNTGITFQSVTYADTDNTAAPDVQIASLLAKALASPYQLLALETDSDEYVDKLFSLKHGINYLGVSFFLQFLEKLASLIPEANLLLTGDGGDKVLPYILPEKHLSNEDDFLSYLYSRNAQFPVSRISGFFGIPVSEINNYLLSVIRNYPANTFAERYKYFLLAERGGRWLFEGEDRNRAYICSETPFYEYDFYRAALSIPDSWKRDYSFYCMFLNYLSPAIAAIPNANNGLRPSSFLYPIISLLGNTIRNNPLWRKLRTSKSSPRPVSFPSQTKLIQKILKYSESRISNQSVPSIIRIQEQELVSLSRTQLYLLFNSLYTHHQAGAS